MQTLREIQRLCDAIDRVVRTADGDSAPPEEQQKGLLSLDVAILEGAEGDPARHDHCGPLYPVNNMRNLALLQVSRRNDLCLFVFTYVFVNPSPSQRGERDKTLFDR